MGVEPRQVRAAKARLRSSDLILGTMGRQRSGTQADLRFRDGETETHPQACLVAPPISSLLISIRL